MLSLQRDILLTPRRGIASGFPATVERAIDGGYSHWFTQIGGNERFNGICRAHVAPGEAPPAWRPFVLRDKPVLHSRQPVIGNLPAGWQPVQPVRIALKGGGYRLWFWAHSPADGVVRYLAADSDNDVVYNCVDPHRPCLWHYCDRAVGGRRLPGVKGLAWAKDNYARRPACEPICPPEMVANDATTLYQLADGSFELFTAAIRSVPKGSPEYISWDNAPGYRRHIRRYTSADGLHFTPSGTVVDFDAEDPPYLQYYHLSVFHREDGSRVGFLGRYDVNAQTMDIERCFSADGLTWRRERRPFLQRKAGELSLYTPCNPLFREADGRMRLFFTAFNYTHNRKYVIGKRLTGVLSSVSLTEKEALHDIR